MSKDNAVQRLILFEPKLSNLPVVLHIWDDFIFHKHQLAILKRPYSSVVRLTLLYISSQAVIPAPYQIRDKLRWESR